MRLTEEQAKVVEENHNLIYWYAKMKNLDLQEWYDLLAIELCNTVMEYNSEIGKLSTFYKKKCDTMVNHVFMKSKTKKRDFKVSHFDDEVLSTPCYTNLEDVSFLDKEFNRKHGEILKLKYEGYSHKEICEMLGVGLRLVRTTLKRFKERYDRTYR